MGLVAKNMTLLHMNTKEADQPAHFSQSGQRLFICSLDSIVAKLAICKGLIF